MTQPLPLPTAYKLKGAIKKLDEEIKKHDELRMGALNRYGSKAKDGKLTVNEHGNAVLTKTNMDKFVKELNELNELEVEIESIRLADLGTDVKISIDDLLMLDGFITD